MINNQGKASKLNKRKKTHLLFKSGLLFPIEWREKLQLSSDYAG